MKLREPGTKRCLICLAAIFILQYALEHLAYVISDAAYSGSISLTAPALSAIQLAVGYTVDAVEICSIAAIWLVALIKLVNGGIPKALSFGGAALAAKLAYLLPHSYMSMLSYGYDSVEALLFALLISFAMLLTLILELSVATLLGTLPAVRRARGAEGNYKELLYADLSKRELTDLGNLGASAMLIASATLSLKMMISAIVGTVSFFATYGSAYSLSDVLRAIFNLAYPLVLIFVAYLVMQLLKHRISLTQDGEEKNEPDANGAKLL